jgi:hypothetical protein
MLLPVATNRQVLGTCKCAVRIQVLAHRTSSHHPDFFSGKASLQIVGADDDRLDTGSNTLP